MNRTKLIISLTVGFLLALLVVDYFSPPSMTRCVVNLMQVTDIPRAFDTCRAWS